MRVYFSSHHEINEKTRIGNDSSVCVQFSRLEEKRQKAERLHQQQKHDNQMREMIGQCEGNVRELQQLQVRGGGVSCWEEVGGVSQP